MAEPKKYVSKKEAYVQQCWSAVHTKQTFAVEYYLSAIGERDDTPVMMLHNGYSRFRLGIIDNSNAEQRKILAANLLAEEVPYLLQQYELAVQDKFQFRQHPEEQTGEGEKNSVSPAYTVQIHVGQFKGQTPAEVLLEDPTRAESLGRTAKWLQDNLTKYPSNGEAIAAIEDALYLLNEGKLEVPAELPQQKNSAILFKEDYKVMMHRDPTKRICCKIEIRCDYQLDNSWSIRIENNVCPLNAAGAVDKQTILERCSTTMSFNDKEFASLMWRLRTMLTQFENMTFPKALAYMEAHAWKPNN